MNRLRFVHALLTLVLLSGSLVACGQGEPEFDFDDMLANEKSLYAEGRSELVIRHFFKDRKNGFYLDVGSFEPKKLSTTYYLEGHLGWTGIAVDAIKELAPMWERDRPNSKFFAYAVTDKSGETITFYEHGGISSIEKENIEAWEKRAQRDFKERKIVVPTITINDLLEREGVEKIDFLSMDINGTEPTALKGFDIQKYLPELVHIEVHERNRLILRKWFEDRGYERIDEYLPHEISNWYFKPRE